MLFAHEWLSLLYLLFILLFISCPLFGRNRGQLLLIMNIFTIKERLLLLNVIDSRQAHHKLQTLLQAGSPVVTERQIPAWLGWAMSNRTTISEAFLYQEFFASLLALPCCRKRTKIEWGALFRRLGCRHRATSTAMEEDEQEQCHARRQRLCVTHQASDFKMPVCYLKNTHWGGTLIPCKQAKCHNGGLMAVWGCL